MQPKVATAVLAAALSATLALPAAAAPPPAALEPETSDTAVLPPPGPHRVWVADIYGGSARIIDGDTGDMLGTIHTASLADLASGPNQSAVYVSESIWTKGNRGTRQDMVTVYDGATLNLKTEITLPGRMYMAPRPALFALNAAGDTGFVYNMTPASSVVVVDLKGQKVARSVDTPGCALVFPWGAAGFSSLCADGALATVSLEGAEPKLSRGKPFFDAEHDPVFQESPSDPATGRTLFVTYAGQVKPVRLGASPAYEAPWSLHAGAGLKAPSLDDAELAWRPGGRLPLAMHNASGRLYVLMHMGEAWSHKKPATELWVADAASRKVLRRMQLEEPVDAVAVTQDAKPLLFLRDRKYVLHVLDATTLQELRKVEGAGDSTLVVPRTPGA